jgi:hypothetical protein
MSRMMRMLPAIMGIAAAFCGGAAPARAQHIFGRSHCPPGISHCRERPPHVHITHGCPKPVCNPCELPNFGYFEPCWRPWPWPTDQAHCRVPSAAAPVIVDAEAPVSLRPSAVRMPGRSGL